MRRTLLLLLLVLGLLWLPAPSSAASVYYVNVASGGLYGVDLAGYVFVDAYGTIIPTGTVQSDYLPGAAAYLPGPGRYYLVPGSPSDITSIIPSLAVEFTYFYRASGSKSVSDASTYSYAAAAQNNVDLAANITATDMDGLYGTAKVGVMFDFTAITDTQLTYNYTITYYSSLVSGSFQVVLDGNVVRNESLATTQYTGTVSVSAGRHHLEIVVTHSGSSIASASGLIKATIHVAGSKIVGPELPQTLAPQPATSITVKHDTQTMTVYAHNFTISSASDQQLEWFIVPVDTSEVSQLTSLNPVVLDVKTNAIRPARLVTLAGQEFIVFQAWSNGTQNEYTIIWNYPSQAGLQGVFADQFTSDPLLAWQESVKTNVSRVEYSNNMLYVYGDSYEYVLARTLDQNYSAGLAYISADYKQLWLGNSSFELMPLSYPEAWTLFVCGALYGANITSDTATLSFATRKIYSYNWTEGSSIAVAVSSDANTTGQIGGVIAVPSMTVYNATFDKQLLRLKIQVERYEIGYSVPSNVGYWTHLVQVVIYYDPTMLPPADYFNVRLLLPEQSWLQQNLVRPGLADIAITDAQSNLVDFWVEPYMLPDGSRGVWVKLPADPSKNMYVLNILLNNTMLTTSLSTPNAFIQYYSESYGLGSSWSQDADGYIVTQNVYVNTVVLVPRASGFGFKLALTPSDYYTVDPYGVTEVHSAYVQQIHNFTGFFVEQQLQWIYFEKSGRLQYYQGKSLLWEVNDLNKPWTWPPTIIGAKDASFIGLAILVPYSYSIGTVTGGQWGYRQQTQTVQVGSSTSKISWSDMGALVIAMLPLIILAIVMRLMNNPPSVSRSQSGGGII